MLSKGHSGLQKLSLRHERAADLQQNRSQVLPDGSQQGSQGQSRGEGAEGRCAHHPPKRGSSSPHHEPSSVGVPALVPHLRA